MVGKRSPVLALALATCVLLLFSALAWATETFTVSGSFTPDRLGASTNLSARAVFSAAGATPTPLTDVTAYGPAGLRVDVRGAGSCQRSVLEAAGPSGCPADSRIGFGGGVGLVEVANELAKAPFTLDLFLGPTENGHLTVLFYVNASYPVTVQLVLVAKETRAPAPYGFGLTFEVPPVPTVPGGGYVSVESAYLTIGSTKVAYYTHVHGRREAHPCQGAHRS